MVVIAQDTMEVYYQRIYPKENPMQKPLSNKQRRAALKAVPKRKREEHSFTYADYLKLPKGGAQ
jgi:hypothetical protein